MLKRCGIATDHDPQTTTTIVMSRRNLKKQFVQNEKLSVPAFQQLTRRSSTSRRCSIRGSVGVVCVTAALVVVLVWFFEDIVGQTNAAGIVKRASQLRPVSSQQQQQGKRGRGGGTTTFLSPTDQAVWNPIPATEIVQMEHPNELYQGIYKWSHPTMCDEAQKQECWIQFPVTTAHTNSAEPSQKDTGSGCVETKQGQKGGSPNQDRSVLAYGKDWTLLGLFDGHGDNGEIASEVTVSELVVRVLESATQTADRESLLRTAFLQVDSGPIMEVRNAGTTAMTVLQVGSRVELASVGDSTAVIVQWFGSEDNDNNSNNKDSEPSERGWLDSIFESHASTESAPQPYKILLQNVKHKPADAEEKRRIEGNGGTVFIPVNPEDSSRVIYLQSDPLTGLDMQVGLAMSRSIGDREAKKQNLVIADPFVASIDLKDYSGDANTKGFFAFLASDGVLDMLPLDGVINALGKALFDDTTTTNLAPTCQRLIEESSAQWAQKTFGQYRDDISLTTKKLVFD